MSRAIDNGGPAFPTIGNIAHNSDWPSDDGMTLRDWFAGQTLAGMTPHHMISGNEAKIMARSAYDVADAMIAARTKGGDA